MKVSKTPTTYPIQTCSPRKNVEDLEAILEQFREIANDLGKESLEPEKS